VDVCELHSPGDLVDVWELNSYGGFVAVSM
jgi:hypothetical protein